MFFMKEYIEIWEHEWDEMVRSNEYVKRFCKDLDERAPLKPRDALYDGRTNAATLHYKCKLNEKIKYYDVTSLYPFVQKTGRYPKGSPIIITENFDQNFFNYFGLVHCRVLPPRKLHFPALPARIDGKLVFALCYKCASQKQEKCNHCDFERMIEGTWITEEVKMALENGYIIDKIYSIWHWNESEMYNPDTKTGGLFTEYVNTFLKIKQENSRFPEWCQTLEEKEKYIKD